MQVLPLDPDAPAFDDWFDVVDRVRRDVRPHEAGWQRGELRALARAGRPGAAEVETVLPFLVRDGDEPVAAGWLELPERDNGHLAGLAHVSVLPHARRRGAGSRLVEAMVEAARAAGRTELVGSEKRGWPPPQGGPGEAFARAHGFAVGQTDVQRDLRLPVPPELLDALEQACAPHARGYRLRTWEDRCPDDLVEDRALLGRRMSTDAPAGDVPVEEEDWDVARVRHAEQLLREQGRARLAVGAVQEATGRLVAYTEVALPTGAPERAYQWDTLVLREHRGHRLGTLVKLANLRRMPAVWPQTRVVSTWNAEENAPMIAVNEALGARPAGTFVEWVRAVSP